MLVLFVCKNFVHICSAHLIELILKTTADLQDLPIGIFISHFSQIFRLPPLEIFLLFRSITFLLRQIFMVIDLIINRITFIFNIHIKMRPKGVVVQPELEIGSIRENGKTND